MVHHHDHSHEDGDDATIGMALGFRILEDGGDLYLAEAEIAPYVDAQEELGITLVFHPLKGIDPSRAEEELDETAWSIDIDDDLNRETGASLADQFQGIMRQLHALSETRLLEYMREARMEEEE